jgi:hypothetical protein
MLHRGERAAPAEAFPVPSTPTDWEPPAPNTSKGEPDFSMLDNPGDRTPFTFRPDFDKTNPKQYKKHSLPTGATPVPADAEGKRSHSEWEFHYKGWTGDGNAHRSGASHDNMFPDSRKGSLDADVLRKLGMTKKRMDEKDALFFYQLILPICKPSNSGIEGALGMRFTVRSKHSQTFTRSNVVWAAAMDISSKMLR